MKTTINRNWAICLLMTLILAACSDKSTPQPEENPDPTPRVVSKLEMVTRHWNIDTAYHDGNFDVSSSGKDIVFYSGGTYTFDGSLNGTWIFTPDSTRIIIDQGDTYEQDWTIEFLSETRFIADFRSPFTNKKSKWIMNEKP
ncbi:MAG: hypothetical protein JXR19_07485 [Bacteroidia bacterium]